MLRRSLVVVTGVLALQALPSFAGTTTGVVTPLLHSVALTAQDTVAQLGGARMVGVTWTSGNPVVQLRWHSRDGWGAWATADSDTTEEGIPGTEPQWRPPGADRVEVRASGSGLRLLTVTDGIVHRVLGARAEAATGRAFLGTVHSRADWGADESLRRKGPSYASRVVAVTVHHTDNVNGYAPADVPALIRADYAYHVQGRGWNDLGYNLLVDQYGGIWEGRAGGLGRATIGAHAEGFNNGTLGVAMIGDMTHTTASPAAEGALSRVVAYASATWHFDPTTSVALRSLGSPRYPRGQVVTLPRVFGHGQTGITDCPGSLLGRLASIASVARSIVGLPPRILSTVLDGAPVHAPSPATVSGTLSAPVGWTITLYDEQGTVLDSAEGTGSRPQLSWDGSRGALPVLPGTTVRWRVVASDGYHAPAVKTGTFQVGLPLLGP